MAQESIEQKPPFASPEEELSFLRGEVLRKERELGKTQESVPREEAIRKELSAYAERKPEDVLTPEHRANELDIERISLDLAPEEHDVKMGELLSILQKKGVRNALRVVEKMNDPHVEDDFHRVLVQYVKEGYPAEGLTEKGPLWNVLHMTLYEISLPEVSGEKNESHRPLKELLSSMEQFYAGMLSVFGAGSEEKRHFTLEIALADKSDEVILYASVPDTKKDLFEKQILSIFPTAEIREQKNDYNIFSQKGSVAGSYATLSRNPIFPLKTYEQFDYDPIHVILNAFSKIEREGGGAALQVVFSPAGDIYARKYKEALSQIQKGVRKSEALDISFSAGGAFLKEVKKIFFSGSPKKKDGEKPPVDESLVENIKNKIGAPILLSNIRLVASAPTKERAEEVLGDIEASFNQLENTGGNRLLFKRSTKGKLASLLKEFSFREFSSDQALPLNTRELATFMHVPTGGGVSSPQFKQLRAKTAPAPLDIPQQGTFLGVNNYRNVITRAYLTKEDRLRHVYVVGQTGTGKTTLLKNMIAQDIASGEGVCMIDPHGTDIADVLAAVPPERYDDVIYFDPGYTERVMALNMLEYDPRFPEQKTFVVDELLSIFRKLFGAVPESMGPAFEQYFRNSTLLVMEHPESGNTLLDVGRVLSDGTFRRMKLSHNKNPLLAQFWENAEQTTGDQSLANFAQYVTNKFDVFLANEIMRPIIAQEKSTFDFRKIMDERKILLVNLSKGRLGDINSNLIGLVLVGKILMAALSRSEQVATSAPFYLYIDEFQNVTTDSIAVILSEARKYKLSLSVAHQFIAQLEENIRDAVFGNVGSVVAFRVGADDAEYLEKQFEPVFNASDLLNIDNLHAFARLLMNGRPAKPFTIEVPLFPHGDEEKVRQLKELSHQKYGRPRAEIEAEVKKKYGVAN